MQSIKRLGLMRGFIWIFVGFFWVAPAQSGLKSCVISLAGNLQLKASGVDLGREVPLSTGLLGKVISLEVWSTDSKDESVEKFLFTELRTKAYGVVVRVNAPDKVELRLVDGSLRKLDIQDLSEFPRNSLSVNFAYKIRLATVSQGMLENAGFDLSLGGASVDQAYIENLVRRQMVLDDAHGTGVFGFSPRIEGYVIALDSTNPRRFFLQDFNDSNRIYTVPMDDRVHLRFAFTPIDVSASSSQ